jgi:hypothetical protein
MGGGSMGGGFAGAPSGRGSFARSAPSGNFAMRSGATGNRAVVPGGRTWTRAWHGRHHFRHRSRFAGLGFGPYFYDDSCWRVALVRGVWRQVWVCY